MAYGDERTHPDVTEAAISKSKLDTYLINTLGIPEGILKTYEANINIINLLRSGSENEDLKSRAFNHFWDPIRNAGLDDPRLLVWQPSGYGNMDWAMGYEYEQHISKPLDNCGPGDHSANKDCNDYSWRRARSLFYEALTSTTEDERNQKFVEFYERLGRVLHLLQDMGVPAHTRNDFLGHVEFSGFDFSDDTVRETVKSWYNNPYEFYVKDQIDKNSSYIFDKGADNKMAVFSKPEYYWDNKVYEGANPDPWETMPTIDGFERSGLAEYSNANFLSRRVKFTEDRVQDDRFFFPYPKKSSVQMMPPELVMAEDGIADFPRYLYKDKDGELIPKFALAKYLFDPIYMEAGADLAWTLAIKLDEEVHEAYATYLIPKTVGYSAGLIDFFFRGKLEISAPDEFVYSIIDGSTSPHLFTHLKAKLKNATPNEEMLDGTILAVAKYKKRTDYQPDLSADPPTAASREADFSYSVSAPIGITSLSSVAAEEFLFDFSANPIPAGITDLYLQVVFKGTLGNEQDIAIAVGMKDLNEPDHHVIWNSTDQIVFNDTLYTAQDIRNDFTAMADLDGDGVFNEVAEGEPYIDPYFISFDFFFTEEDPQTTPPTQPATASIQNLPPEGFSRIIILTDISENESAWLTLESLREWESEPVINYWSFQNVIAQDKTGEPWNPTPLAPEGYTHRGVSQHHLLTDYYCLDFGYPCSYLGDLRPVPQDLTPFPIDIHFP